MRVLQVLSSLNRISGVANVVMNYYRMIQNEVTFDFLLYGRVDDSFENEAKEYGSRIFYIPKFSLATYGKYKKAVKEFFMAHAKEYDLVHIHEILSQRIIIPVAHDCGLKVVLHSHGPYPDRKMVGTVKALRNYFLLKGFDKNADFYLACSEHAGKAFKNRNDVVVLKNGVDIERYINGTDMREEMGISKETFVVGFVGRIAEQKNPSAIIEIFAQVKNLHENSVLIMAGEGEDFYVELVKSLIKKYGLEKDVMLLGNCKRVPELMRSFNVFFMPSLWEGLPVVLVEAQAIGLPCICSDNVPQEGNLTGNVKFIPLSVGYDKWAKGILAGHKIDEAQIYDGFKKTGYDLGINAKALLNIYRGVINNEQE